MPAHVWTKRQHAKFKATTIAKRKARALAELGQDAVVAINESAEPDTVRVRNRPIEPKRYMNVRDATVILELAVAVLKTLTAFTEESE